MKNVTTALFSHYQQHQLKHRPFIVGIDGLGGSGKTTLALNVKQEFMLAKYDAVILHMDNYIVEKSERYGTGNEEWYEYYALQWNIEQLRKELFQRLHRGSDSITLPFYESSADSVVSKPIQLEGVKVVLIEGVFLQRKEWRDFFDYVIFLDCPPNSEPKESSCVTPISVMSRQGLKNIREDTGWQRIIIFFTLIRPDRQTILKESENVINC